jgi:serine/threonine-protein kinase
MRSNVTYKALGPLLAGEGSRAFLGIAVTDKDTARPIVLIWLPPEVAEDNNQVAKIHQETQRAVLLEHPNIIRVHGLAAMDEGVARIVEFADGESLRKILEVCGPLPLPFAALVAAEAATGLHYAHLAGNDDGSALVHGDIRPETLMICFSGFTKVSGFGALSVAPRELGGKRVPHRRLYSAPEQVVGGRASATVQTDVYLLGLTLYECLTGEKPFANEANVDQAVVNKPLSLEGREEIPTEVRALVEAATAKSVASRPGSPLEFREALEAAVGPLPSHEEFAQYLAARFPEDDPTRAARRQILDSGMADYRRKVWEPGAQTSGLHLIPPTPEGGQRARSAPPAPAPAPAAKSVPPSAPAPAARPAASAPKPQPKSKAPEPAPRRSAPAPRAALAPERRSSTELPAINDSGAPQRSQRSMIPIIIASSVGAAVLTGLVMAFFLGHPAQPAVPVATPPPQAPAPSAPSAASPPEKSTAAATEGNAPATHTNPVKPAAFKTDAAPVLQLTTIPALNVLIDKKPVGRTPLTVPLTSGRHVMDLSDPQLGIHVRRTFTMPRTGKEVESFAVNKAYVSVDIPAGSTLYLDNKKLGTSSVKDYQTWEGNHHLLVTIGTAKWQQRFDVGANEHMTYKVEATH